MILRAAGARDRATIARLPLEPDIGRFFGEELPERRPRTADEVEELYGWLAGVAVAHADRPRSAA